MNMTPGDPGAGPGGQRRGQPLGRLLRWYPRAWRERYGDEFLAMVEDTLDGGGPGWRLRLGVARSGLRERGRGLARSRRKRGLGRLGMFVMTGCVLAGVISDAGENRGTAGSWQAAVAVTVLAVLGVVTGAAIVAAVTIARRPLARFLRAGGWPEVRVRVIAAVVATGAAAGVLTWLVLLQTSMTAAQLSTSPAYSSVFVLLTLILVTAIGLWAMAASAVATHLELGPRIRAAETLLGAAISTGVLTMVPVQITWFGIIRSSVFWMTVGLGTLIGSVSTVPITLRRARRQAWRLRATAAGAG